ncbi:MAG: hypothetical protein ACK4UJ_06265 [Leptonema sp. (in: bacteria)]
MNPKKKIGLLFLVFYQSLYAQTFNSFELESINHWNLKISSVRWESATIRNALEIPYVTFSSDLLKGKYNLLINDSPKAIRGIGIQLSTPKCSKEKCSDLYIQLITSPSDNFLSTRQFSESAKSTFTTITDTQTLTSISTSETLFSTQKQILRNLSIGYSNDYYFLQENTYTKNLGIRFGFSLDTYNYIANTSGIENLNSILISEFTNNPSNNSTNSVSSTIWNRNELNYFEVALKIKIGINYIYEFLEKNLIFLNVDYFYGYGAVSYKLKESKINLDLFNILNSTTNNPLALLNAIPKSKLTDGPAFLEIPGYEVYISYGYKIMPNQILRIVYKKKEEFHNLRSPKIEPDENINLTALQTADLTPLILSELKPMGLLPNSKEVMRELGIEYMYRF